MTQNKISNFFTAEDTLKNQLGLEQTYVGNKLAMYNVNYSASRMDLIKFVLRADITIVNWFLTEEIITKLGMYPNTPHGRGLGIEFKVSGSKGTKYAYDVLKNKILGKNYITLSVDSLVYNEEKDTISVTFRTNIDMEGNKLAYHKKGQRFHWEYIGREKVVVEDKSKRNVSKKLHSSDNGKFGQKNSFNKGGKSYAKR